MRHIAALLATLIMAVGCGSTTTERADAASTTTRIAVATSTTVSAPTTVSGDDAAGFFPDVIDVVAAEQADGWRFDVTISSPYDSPTQYADAWRVLAQDGTELALRILTHDHASEQPFTRSQSGIQIPADIERVTVEGRDLLNGWGGATLEITLER